MAKPEIVKGVVKIDVPIDYEELQRQIQENEDMTKIELTEKDIKNLEFDSKRLRNSQHITMKEYDEIMARLDQMERRIEDLFIALGKANSYDI